MQSCSRMVRCWAQDLGSIALQTLQQQQHLSRSPVQMAADWSAALLEKEQSELPSQEQQQACARLLQQQTSGGPSTC